MRSSHWGLRRIVTFGQRNIGSLHLEISERHLARGIGSTLRMEKSMIETMKNIGVAVILSAAVATPVLAQGYAPPPSEQHYNYGQQPPPTNQPWGAGAG